LQFIFIAEARKRWHVDEERWLHNVQWTCNWNCCKDCHVDQERHWSNGKGAHWNTV